MRMMVCTAYYICGCIACTCRTVLTALNACCINVCVLGIVRMLLCVDIPLKCTWISLNEQFFRFFYFKTKVLDVLL